MIHIVVTDGIVESVDTDQQGGVVLDDGIHYDVTYQETEPESQELNDLDLAAPRPEPEPQPEETVEPESGQAEPESQAIEEPAGTTRRGPFVTTAEAREPIQVVKTAPEPPYSAPPQGVVWETPTTGTTPPPSTPDNLFVDDEAKQVS